jgi:hypothetical protein
VTHPCLKLVPPRRVAATGALLMLALCPGCYDDWDLPLDVTWESAHFRYHLREGDESACEGVLEQLERHFELFHTYLGLPWPEGKKIDYYKYRNEMDYVQRAPCPERSAGCAGGSAVMSYFVLQEHELIHAYFQPLGQPPRFFVEGIAVALACNDPFAELVGAPSWQDMVALPTTDRDAVYSVGSWFVGYLLDRYGPAPFVTLYRALDGETLPAERIAATFAGVYGEALEVVWKAALAAGPRARCVTLGPCQGAAMALDGSPQTVARACDGSDNSRTFQLAVDTDLLWSYDRMVHYVPVRCDSPSFTPVTSDPRGVAATAAVVRATAGKYFVRAVGFERSGELRIGALAQAAYGRSCGETQPIDLGQSEFTRPKMSLELTVPNDGKAWFVRLRVPGDWQFWHTAAASSALETCLACDDPPSCHAFRGDVAQAADGVATLRLLPAVTDPPYRSYSFGFRLRPDGGVDASNDGGAPDGGG